MKANYVIYILAATKLILHSLTSTNLGLHRDEYLYFAEGQHLGWGFMEGPPMIGPQSILYLLSVPTPVRR